MTKAELKHVARVPGPAIAEERLRRRLVAYRERAHLTQAEVVSTLDWSISKIHRIENGPQPVQTSDVVALLAVYNVADDAKEEVIRLARSAREPALSSDFGRPGSSSFSKYLDYEAYAARICNYQPKTVPGPIQIAGYASAILTTFAGATDERDIQRRVNLRNKRADLLLGKTGPSIQFIIDEGALHHAVGGEDTGWDHRYDAMLRLVKHLKASNTVARKHGSFGDLNPNVSIQIVPFEYGVYPAFRAPFVVLDFDKDPQGLEAWEGEEERPRVFFEWPNGSQLTDDPARVAMYQEMFDALAESIPGPEVTADILDHIATSFQMRLETFPQSARLRARDLTPMRLTAAGETPL